MEWRTASNTRIIMTLHPHATSPSPAKGVKISVALASCAAANNETPWLVPKRVNSLTENGGLTGIHYIHMRRHLRISHHHVTGLDDRDRVVLFQPTHDLCMMQHIVNVMVIR
jgi:hypothetical protein